MDYDDNKAGNPIIAIASTIHTQMELELSRNKT
jgi:hypothetical protein